jgi:hypothetical protein
MNSVTDFAPAQKENTLESPLTVMQADYAGGRQIDASQAIVTETIYAALSRDHRDHMLSEGFAESQVYRLVKDYGIRSMAEIEARELGFVVADEKRKNTKGTVSSSGLYFPFKGDFGQLRCDNPPIRNGKPCKYLTPTWQTSQAWIPDEAGVVTEGYKDAAAGTLHGRIPTGAIAGVSHVRKALEKGCNADLLFDSDGWTNPSVFAALISGADWTGGKIQLIPEIEDQPKAGLCEYFKAGHTAEDYDNLLDGAMSIQEFLLELPNHWGNLPTKNIARALRTISVLATKHLFKTDLAILASRLKKFGKTHEIPASEVTRSIKAAQPKQVVDDKKCVADKLVELASEAGIQYFQTEEGTIYADVRSEEHLNTWPIDGKDFKNWLRRAYVASGRASVAGDAVNQAIATISAINDGVCPEGTVNLRVAKHDGAIYFDLRDRGCRAIKITSEGWEITQDYPVRFKPGSGVQSPDPVKGGDLELLRNLCGFDFDNWVLVIMFLIQWLYPTKGYPVMFLVAPPQSGKTTIAELLKKLADPSAINLLLKVSDERDTAIHASRRHVILVDNVSYLSEDQSNMLCGIATGSGFSTRTLHSNGEETVFKLNNPMIFTGIAAIASKGDLLSRGLTVELSPPDGMISPEEFENRFEALRPIISGALFDLLSKVLGILPSVEGTYKGRERFGRFIELGLAIEQVLGWPAGTVTRVVSAGREAAHETAIEASPVGQTVQELMLGRECWTGTMSKLFDDLAAIAGEKRTRGQYWPSDPTRLAKKLNELKPNFAACGIEVTAAKSNGTKIVTIERIAVAATVEHQAEALPATTPELKVGDTVVITASSHRLPKGCQATVTALCTTTHTDDDPIPKLFLTVKDSDGNPHSIWPEHLRPATEADRLGSWEVAA